jgi:hypothetical protein
LNLRESVFGSAQVGVLDRPELLEYERLKLPDDAGAGA